MVLYWKIWEDDFKFDIEKNKNIKHVLLVIIIWARFGAVFVMINESIILNGASLGNERNRITMNGLYLVDTCHVRVGPMIFPCKYCRPALQGIPKCYSKIPWKFSEQSNKLIPGPSPPSYFLPLGVVGKCNFLPTNLHGSYLGLYWSEF